MSETKTEATSAAVEIRGLTKRFDGRTAVDNVDLVIPSGSIYGLVGANGAGKSTLLQMMLGLIWPTEGDILLFGRPLPREAADIRQRVHLVSTENQMFRAFRVHEMLRYASMLYTRWDGDRAKRLLDALELPQNRRIRSLSTGMKMQLSLAIALSARPDLLVLDEPTNGLDPVVKRQFMQLIVQEAAGEGTTVVLATHLLEDVERIADGLAVMYEGKVVASGVMDDLKQQVHRIQTAMPNGLPPSIEDHDGVAKVERQGQVFTLTVEGKHVEEIERALWSAGALFVETIHLDLSDLFRYLMQKEGYTRDGILLS